MKRIISISFIALSSLIILILAVVPHHHHQGMICMAMEICSEDHCVNDEHTKHHNSPEGNQCDQSCIAESKYTAPQENKEIKCKIYSCQENHSTHLFPLYFLTADFIVFNTDTFDFGIEYEDYIQYYTSAETSSFNGLRAPPYMLV